MITVSTQVPLEKNAKDYTESTANKINQMTVHKSNGDVSPQNKMYQWYDDLLFKKNMRATGVKSAWQITVRDEESDVWKVFQVFKCISALCALSKKDSEDKCTVNEKKNIYRKKLGNKI